MIRLMLLAAACLASPDGPPVIIAAEPSYEQLKAAAGRDADAQVKLALWCEAHGLEREKLRHLAVAVLADPTNAMARGLMGLVEYRGKWKRPEAVAEAVRTDVAHADLLAEYNGRRVRTPVKPDAQWKLALWCEEKGLKDEARAHLATVVRLDPKNAEAWKKLGYKKVGNRWATEAESAAQGTEREVQKKADRAWHARLVPIRDRIAVRATRAEAERELSTVSDPRSVPSIVKVFVDPQGKHHLTAVQLLGQVDAIEASRALATLALFDTSDEVRRRATETLRRRDPREWADLPIGLIRSKIKYEVKPVGGPGSPGELYIEGKKANLKRIYTPADLPRLQPGDRLVYDDQGRLMLVRTGQPYQIAGHTNDFAMEMAMGLPLSSNPAQADWLFAARQMADTPVNPAQTAAQVNRALAQTPLAGHGAQVASALGTQLSPAYWDRQRFAIAQSQLLQATPQGGIFFGSGSRMTATVAPTVSAPVQQLVKDAYNSAAVAAQQLKADVAALDAANDQIAKANERAIAVLAGATGLPFADDRKGWEKWYVNQVGYAFMTPEDKPTVVESVPIDYQPSAVPSPGTEVIRLSRASCFGKGTPVRTLSGPRPIEDLNVGDLVLTQDTRSAKLGYRPITVVHHNPPSPTYDIRLGDDTVVSSHFHRFWVAGRGWVMARDLKAGDPVRTLGGVSKVASIEPGAVQPVFNLDIEGDADFFAGASAALVHDNTLPDLKQQPFDAPPAVAAR